MALNKTTITFVVYAIPNGRSEVEEITERVEAYDLGIATDTAIERVEARGYEVTEVRHNDRWGALLYGNPRY